MSDRYIIKDVVVGGDIDKAPYKVCPFCGADLTETGVEGFNAVDFVASANPDDLSYAGTWATKFNKDIQGVVVDCPSCHRHLQMTGIYAQMWRDHHLLDLATWMIRQLGKAGYIPEELTDEYRKVVAGNILEVGDVYQPVDIDGKAVGDPLQTYDEAFEETTRRGLAGVTTVKSYLTAVAPQYKTNEED